MAPGLFTKYALIVSFFLGSLLELVLFELYSSIQNSNDTATPTSRGQKGEVENSERAHGHVGKRTSICL